MVNMWRKSRLILQTFWDHVHAEMCYIILQKQ